MPVVKWIFAALIALAGVVPLTVSAASAAATVEAVQAPAWLDRNGLTMPLAPGMELRNGDLVRTGEGARAYLLLAEGSRVKLAESARFALYSRSTDPHKYFRGALDVLAGAFRFTTNSLMKKQQRDISIRVATATIGIRGTDIWGRTTSEGELVALLEGKIEIVRGGEVTELTQPMTYFDAPTGAPATVQTLDPGVLRELARQTEIESGDGAARSRGNWRVLIGTADSSQAALELYDQVRDAGFAARIQPRTVAASVSTEATAAWRFQLAVNGFSSEADARKAADRLKALVGIKANVSR